MHQLNCDFHTSVNECQQGKDQYIFNLSYLLWDYLLR